MINNIHELFDSLPQTILLVGNGECKNSGDLIDSYEYVIRFNDFQIINYEHHAGKKIDALSFHTWDLDRPEAKNLHYNYYKYNNIIPIFTLQNGNRPIIDNKGNIKSISTKYNIISQSYNTQILSQDPPINPKGARLSSGVGLAISLALLYDRNVHLIGFDFMKTNHYYDQSHIHQNEHSLIDQEKIIKKISTITII